MKVNDSNKITGTLSSFTLETKPIAKPEHHFVEPH